MNILFWNIRGISTPGKKTCIVDTLAKTNPSIVAFQETKLERFSTSFPKSIRCNRNFAWHHLPTNGTAGGILVGVDTDIFYVLSWNVLKFSVSCILKLKSSGISFRLVYVYGSPYDEGKDDFISELHNLCLDDHHPTLFGGDFNLTRYQKDKSNGRINHRWSDKFNAWIHIWSLLEIKISGRQFTWANNQSNLVMSTIDRIFCTIELDVIFPSAFLKLSLELAVTIPPSCGTLV